MTVDPLTAAGGSAFVFSGSGYEPTQLVLQKAGGDPSVHDLNLGNTDPWQVTVRSQVGDQGTWTATFSIPGTDCSAEVQFLVTLSNTDAISDSPATPASGPAPMLLYLAVVAVGFGGGALLGRRLRAGRA